MAAPKLIPVPIVALQAVDPHEDKLDRNSQNGRNQLRNVYSSSSLYHPSADGRLQKADQTRPRHPFLRFKPSSATKQPSITASKRKLTRRKNPRSRSFTFN
jgi:hypothetical protein